MELFLGLITRSYSLHWMLLWLLKDECPVITWCCVSVPEACSAFPSSVWTWAVGLCFQRDFRHLFRVTGTSIPVCSLLHQPLLLTWLEDSMCKFSSIPHVTPEVRSPNYVWKRDWKASSEECLKTAHTDTPLPKNLCEHAGLDVENLDTSSTDTNWQRSHWRHF